jgi:hypothetical protein
MLQVPKFPEGTWLIFSKNLTSDLTFLSNIPIPLESPFLLAEEVNTGVSLAEVYHVHLTRPLQKYKVADWNSVRGIVWFVNRRRRDLQGVTIRAAYRKQVIYVVTFLRTINPVQSRRKCNVSQTTSASINKKH